MPDALPRPHSTTRSFHPNTDPWAFLLPGCKRWTGRTRISFLWIYTFVGSLRNTQYCRHSSILINTFNSFICMPKNRDRHRSQHTTTTKEIHHYFVLLPNISIIELGSNWFDELDWEYFLLNASKSKISCSCLEAPSLLATSICMATTNSDKTTVHESTDTGGYAMMVHFNFFLFFIIHHSSALVTYCSRFLLGRPQAQHTL